MLRPFALDALVVTLSACCMTDDPTDAVAFAVNRCAFSVSGMPPLSDGTTLDGTYIDESPTLERPAENNTVSRLRLRCAANVAGGRRVSIVLGRFDNRPSFQILDGLPDAEWEVRTTGGGDALFRSESSPESSASIQVERVATFASRPDRTHLESSFSFSIVDYAVEEGSYVSVEGTTQ